MSPPMLSPKGKLAMGGIALLMALVMLPNLIWLGYSHSPWIWVEGLLLPAVLLAALFALLGRWLWLACVLLTPFSILAPIEIYFVAKYHVPSTPQTIATLMATNVQEASGYLGHFLILAFLLPVSAGALSLLAGWWTFQSRLQWAGRARTWIAVIAIATPLVSSAVGFAVAKGPINERAHNAGLPLAGLAEAVESGFPFGIVQRYAAYQQAWDRMRYSASRFKNFSFHARREDIHVGAQQVYVLVIGESSARDHWQIFGYDRSTNPMLSKTTNLVPITRMVTSWPDTILAVPLLLTRKPITSRSPEWKEPSFLPAMQEAGFQTWWISNQYPIGKFDSPVAIYAYEAEHVIWVNHSATWNNPGSPDGDLVPALQRLLIGSKGDLFIVLHMMGSHMSYDYRYPATFALFRPTQSDVGVTAPNNMRVRNSYDNTILYTDHVLAKIIDVLKRSGAVTALWYESDHGEKLPSATCDKGGHGFGTRSEYEIPAFFWYSTAYAKNFPQRITLLRANASIPSLSASTFETMIDMADVSFPSHDESWSLFSSKWQFHSRLVNQFWETDFDHASAGKLCGILMPADRPTSKQ